MQFQLRYMVFNDGSYRTQSLKDVESRSICMLRRRIIREKSVNGSDYITVFSYTAKSKKKIGIIKRTQDLGLTWMHEKDGHGYLYQIKSDGTLGKKKQYR